MLTRCNRLAIQSFFCVANRKNANICWNFCSNPSSPSFFRFDSILIRLFVQHICVSCISLGYTWLFHHDFVFSVDLSFNLSSREKEIRSFLEIPAWELRKLFRQTHLRGKHHFNIHNYVYIPCDFCKKKISENIQSIGVDKIPLNLFSSKPDDAFSPNLKFLSSG